MLSIKELHIAFGGRPLMAGVTFQIRAGDRICLVGRNGSGKSTLLKLLAGEILPDSGRLTGQRTIKSAYLPQAVPAGDRTTVFEMVARGAGETGRILIEHHRSSGRSDLVDADGSSRDAAHLAVQLESKGGWECQYRVEKILSTLRLEPEARFSELSAGLKRRVLLGRTLVNSPELLLLDEPTNHMDIPSIRLIETILAKTAAALVFVSHDRRFTRNIATRILELDRGRLRDWNCSYDDFLHRREKLLNEETLQHQKFDRKLAKEEAWLRQGLKARRTRNEGRVRALEKLRKLRDQRRERIGRVKLTGPAAGRSGKIVFEIRQAEYQYNGQWYVRDFSTTILRGDKVGIIGPNGCGKTTLLGLILGRIDPGGGFVRHGTKIELAYFDQLREQLDPDKTVQDNIADGNEVLTIGGRRRHVIGYLKDFLFSPDRARSPVRTLSGGEVNRLLLARLFTRPANVLVLDEPTNDLDAETLELLEEQLIDYPGTLLLVSHDRDFLNNVVTSTLVFEGEGLIGEYAGGYDDWRTQSRPAPEDAGHRVKQKTKSAGQPTRRPRKKKLGYNEQRELEALPGRIEVLETKQQDLYTKMSAPDFYAREGTAIAQTKKRLEEIEAEIELACKRWEKLQAMSETA